MFRKNRVDQPPETLRIEWTTSPPAHGPRPAPRTASRWTSCAGRVRKAVARGRHLRVLAGPADPSPYAPLGAAPGQLRSLPRPSNKASAGRRTPPIRRAAKARHFRKRRLRLDARSDWGGGPARRNTQRHRHLTGARSPGHRSSDIEGNLDAQLRLGPPERLFRNCRAWLRHPARIRLRARRDWRRRESSQPSRAYRQRPAWRGMPALHASPRDSAGEPGDHV